MRLLPLHIRIRALLASLLGIAASVITASCQNLRGDEALSKILEEGEDWKLVASGYKFTDAACADAAGRFYFSDVSAGDGIHQVDLEGGVSTLVPNAPKLSGMKFGPDGRLYACAQSPKKQIVAFVLPAGTMTVLADDVQPNDLVVTKKGYVYFTETGKGQVTVITPQGVVRLAAKGITAPNGIGLSPDHGTLAVSEYTGSNVWAYRIDADGALSGGERYMQLQTPAGAARSEGDGMTVDADGRYYVTSALGIQMFDATGRLSGIISRPQAKGTVSCAFAGKDFAYLYACSSDKVFRRKLKVRGR
ncbi:MAG: SMP-30/gluconolactonase/LRE family protein [Verrucomicrobia bacterium]|nr:SMP-30/gluconolactonase/LRE family protein [Verrucomicrobiota bacterium]MBI3867562.1 SMP-30/gluconolactonase/LRE family protein [Verrucomicrobiota bacterium]